MGEPVLEPLLRRMRLAKVLREIRGCGEARLLDIGCGWEGRFLAMAAEHVAHAVGIDPKAPPCRKGNLEVISARIEGRLPFPDASFEIVTMLAVLEHLADPAGVVEEIERVLTPTGMLVLTVPSPMAKPVLEFFSYRLGLVNADEIRDHKEYYDKRSLQRLFSGSGLRLAHHSYFQFGMNNLCVVKKGTPK